jgi:hypothetical protein
LVLGSLHGECDKSSSYFSNQMPRTISLKPAYSVRYWKERDLSPPSREVFDILKQRAGFRFETGKPPLRGEIQLGDARMVGDLLGEYEGHVKLVVTSPPYFNVTNYEEDQWLRLWFLGHEPHPTYGEVSHDDRHCRLDDYWNFLLDVWESLAPLMRRSAVIVCRIAGNAVRPKDITENLVDTLSTAFPAGYLIAKPQLSKIKKKQTDYFRPGSSGCFFEIDHAFRVS